MCVRACCWCFCRGSPCLRTGRLGCVQHEAAERARAEGLQASERKLRDLARTAALAARQERHAARLYAGASSTGLLTRSATTRRTVIAAAAAAAAARHPKRLLRRSKSVRMVSRSRSPPRGAEHAATDADAATGGTAAPSEPVDARAPDASIPLPDSLVDVRPFAAACGAAAAATGGVGASGGPPPPVPTRGDAAPLAAVRSAPTSELARQLMLERRLSEMVASLEVESMVSRLRAGCVCVCGGGGRQGRARSRLASVSGGWRRFDEKWRSSASESCDLTQFVRGRFGWATRCCCGADHTCAIDTGRIDPARMMGSTCCTGLCRMCWQCATAMILYAV